MMHTMQIVFATLIVLGTISLWMVVGLVMVSLLEKYESEQNDLATCFFWPLFIVAWVVLVIFDNEDKCGLDCENCTHLPSLLKRQAD